MENYETQIRQYAEEVQKKIRELAPGIETKIDRGLKVNRGEYLAIVRSDMKVAPSLDLGKCLKANLTVEHAANIFIQFQNDSMAHIHPEFFAGMWSDIRGDIYPCLINTYRNRKLLEKAVSRPFCDLSICYKICLFSDEGIESCLVQSWMLERWNVSGEDLHEQAVKNLAKIDEGIISLEQMLAGLRHAMLVPQFGEETADAMTEEFLKETSGQGMPMYVWSNKSHCWGAGMILRTEVLGEFFEKHGNGRYVYIIPSSINEVILVPSSCIGASDLRDIIGQVNSNEVPPSEFLSDNVYIYDGLTGEIEVYDEAAKRAV